MQLVNKISEDMSNKIRKNNPSFDILLAATIVKVICDIIVCFIRIQNSTGKAYSRYEKMGPVERVIIKSYVAKHFPKGSEEYKEVSKLLIEEKFSKETIESVYKEVLENK